MAGKVHLGPQGRLASCLDPMPCPVGRVDRAQWQQAILCRRGSLDCRGRRGSKGRRVRREQQGRQEQKDPSDPGDQVGGMGLQVGYGSILCIAIQ